MNKTTLFPLFLSLTASLGSTAQSATTVNNCGLKFTVTTPPKRAVTLNQGATEVMLSLGLQDRMVGTAYLDDAIHANLKAAYDKVPVLAKEYPSREVLLNAAPDFIYGSYSSAFGKEVAGARADLVKQKVTPYLSPIACEVKALRPKQMRPDDIYNEIMTVARIFGVTDRGTALVGRLRREALQAQGMKRPGAAPKVWWWDSDTKTPLSGGNSGAPGMIMRLIGAKNVFDDLDGSWKGVSWETVLGRDIDAIVIVDASWDTAKSKIDYLTGNPRFSAIKAVREKRFIIVPFSETTPGVGVMNGAKTIARALYKR